MEVLFSLLAFALIIWIIVGPFVAIAALRRAKQAQEDLLRLRRWVARLDRGEHLLPREGEAGFEAGATDAPQSASRSADPIAASTLDAPRTPARTATPAAPLPFRTEPAEKVSPKIERAAAVAHEVSESPAPLPSRRVTEVEPKSIEWERWVGVRGAALLGGVLFALAAIFLYMHAVEQQWITPRSRVFSGTSAGLAMLGVAEFLRRRSYQIAPGAVAAAGIVALYASTWAAHELYAMIGQAPALAAFAAITALCVGLALRHASQFVAVLGLLGGFATPLVLQMPAGNPIGLFGYLLLLNAGLLMVGRRQAWHSLGMLGIFATGAIEVYWAFAHAGPDEALIGLGALSAIALLFIAVRPSADRVEPALVQISRSLVVLTPMLLGLYFAQRVDLRMELWVIASYAAFLTIGGIVLARRQGNPSLSIACAVALTAVVSAWAVGPVRTDDFALELCGVSVGLVILFAAISRIEGTQIGRWCSFTIQTALLILLAGLARALPSEPADSPWPWFGASALCLVALFEHRSLGVWRLVPCFAGGALAAITLYFRTPLSNPYSPADGVLLGAAAVFGVALTVAGFIGSRKGDSVRIVAAATAIAPLLLLYSSRLVGTSGGAYAGSMSFLALCIAALSARVRSGWLLQSAIVLAGVALFLHPLLVREYTNHDLDWQSSWTLVAVLTTSALLTAWPALLRTRYQLSTSAWRAAATAAPLLYIASALALEAQWGRSWKLLAPAFVALCLLVVDGLFARTLDPETRSANDVSVRRVARTWLRGMAAPFVAAALVLWANDTWGILWFAITGALLALVARRERHPGPACWSAFALVCATAGLSIAGFARWYETSERFLFNRMSLDGWGAALCAGAALWCATRPNRLHLEQSRPWVRRAEVPLIVALSLALAGSLFQWINLTVFDHWSDSTHVVIRFDHLPARDLTLSSSWIVYGLAWLGVGMWKRISAARWVSLALLLLSLGKVFLFDLAHLEGLYRVASLLGLGLSLVSVSLLYQRFVFRK